MRSRGRHRCGEQAGEGRQRRAALAGLCGVLLTLAGALALWAGPAQAALVHEYTSQLTEREGEPLTSILCGVNVDPGSGEVYVADLGAEVNEIERPAIDVFSPASAFVGKIDKGVGTEWAFREACSTAVNDTNGLIYVANAGEGEGEELDEKAAVFVYKLEAGKYKLQTKLTLDGSNTPARTFQVEGFPPGTFEGGGPLNVAVAQASQDVYVAVGEQHLIDKFNSSGEYLGQITFPGESAPRNLATDAAGNLYAVVTLGSELHEGNEAIYEFNPAGTLVNRITGATSGGFGHLSGVAVDSSGHIYASDSQRQLVDEFDPSGAFMGRITGEKTPAGTFVEPTGVAVNGEGDVYVADRTLNAQLPGVVDIFAPAKAGAGPFLEAEWASGVSSTSATLAASIDPTGVDTKYRFEYGPEGGPLTSTQEVDIGSGESIQRVEAHVQNLVPSTTYRFRAVVTAEGHPSEEGELKTFTTQPEGILFGLPDGRGWELVSPQNKLGALIKGTGGTGVVQASAAGDRITYAATAPVETGAEANIGFAPVLSVRHGGGGWSSREIIPPDALPVGSNGTGSNGLENQLFSTDLSSALLDPFKEKPLLSPAASEQTPYLRDLNVDPCLITQTSCFEPLVTGKEGFADVPSEIKFGEVNNGIFGQVRIAGSTPDVRHAVLKSNVALKKEFNGKPFVLQGGLYEWSSGSPPAETLKLVSVLPSGEPPISSESPSLGVNEGGQEVLRHAISDSGARIVWSTAFPNALYLRDTSKEETIKLDAPEEGVTPEGPARPFFQTASSNGSVVFFTDEQKLTKDATAGAGRPDLYACRITPAEGGEGPLACKLSDLTGTGVVKNLGEAAAVQGDVLGGREDGAYVYFVANGVLSSAANARGEEAEPGHCGGHPPLGAKCNLYVEHYESESETWSEPAFIAALSSEDSPDWAGFAHSLARLTSRVSPNGEYLAFMSERRLTGFDNADAALAAGGTPDEEVFLYGLQSNSVVCASCNRYGQRPHGMFRSPEADSVVDHQRNWIGRWLGANIPGWQEFGANTGAQYQTRYLTDSGRLFFNSADALVPQDANGTQDVYEYEPNGVGGCASASGCQALISSGTSHEEAAFLDASESGGDAFFLTISSLVPEDVDQSYDVYDAHVCTGESPCFSSPPPPAPCNSSTSCQGASSTQTGSAPPASMTLSGSGNLVQPPASGGSPATTTKPTRAQLLAKALANCRKKYKGKSKTHKRAACQKRAKKKYGAKAAGRRAHRSRSHSSRRAH